MSNYTQQKFCLGAVGRQTSDWIVRGPAPPPLESPLLQTNWKAYVA